MAYIPRDSGIRIPKGATAPKITQPATTSGAGANLEIDVQPATTSGSSGNLIVNVGAPASGTTESGFLFQRAGTTWAYLGAPNGVGGSGVQLSLGSGASGGSSTSFVEAVSGGTIVNAPSAGFVNLTVSAIASLQATSSTVSFAVPIQGLTTNTPIQLTPASVAMSTGTVTVASTANYLKLTGSLSGNNTLVLPSKDGAWWYLDATQITFNAHTITPQANSNNWGTVISAAGVWLVFYNSASGKLWGTAITS